MPFERFEINVNIHFYCYITVFCDREITNMKFIELSFDCLEEILEYLTLIDLLNVADSSKRLKKAAELVYARKYGKEDVEFKTIRISSHRLFEIDDKSNIIIEDLKTSLQLLRCIGCVIFSITFSSLPTTRMTTEDIEIQLKIDSKILIYINNYCTVYLKKFALFPSVIVGSDQWYGSDFLDYFDKPFEKVVDFSTLDCNFSDKTCITRIFPKLERLMCHHLSNVSFYRFNINHLRDLEELYVKEYAIIESSLTNEMVIAFLQQNPQLKELRLVSSNFLSSNLNITLLWDAVDSL